MLFEALFAADAFEECEMRLPAATCFVPPLFALPAFALDDFADDFADDFFAEPWRARAAAAARPRFDVAWWPRWLRRAWG